MRRIINVRASISLRTQERCLFYFFRRILSIVSNFHHVNSYRLVGSANCNAVAICFVSGIVDRASRFSVNSVFRARRFAVQRDFRSRILGFTCFLRASLVASHVLRALIAPFAGQAEDNFRILLDRSAYGVVQGRFVLYRRVQLRPGARKMINSWRVHVPRA